MKRQEAERLIKQAVSKRIGKADGVDELGMSGFHRLAIEQQGEKLDELVETLRELPRGTKLYAGAENSEYIYVYSIPAPNFFGSDDLLSEIACDLANLSNEYKDDLRICIEERKY